MTKLNLGRVVGQDAGFGNVSSTYTNNGGEPSVNISLSGENAAKDWQFDFQNITEDPLTSSEVEQICNDKIINTTKKLSGTGLMVLWNQIKAKFAAKSHKHGSADITSVNGTVIEDSTVGLAKLDADANKKLSDMEKGIADNAASWDSLSQKLSISCKRISFWHNSGPDEAVMYFELADGTKRRMTFKTGGGVTITSE